MNRCERERFFQTAKRRPRSALAARGRRPARIDVGRGELADHLDAMPEAEIGYAGIPPLGDEFFRTAEPLMPRPTRA